MKIFLIKKYEYFKYFLRKFTFLRIYFSPFKPPNIKFYVGKVRIGCPYFLPRTWRKFTPNECVERAIEAIKKPNNKKTFSEWYDYYKTHLTTQPKKVGFDFVGLGYKYKFGFIRFEWSPLWSFVFFGLQIAILFKHEEEDALWESWLYYLKHTDKTKSKEERIKQCLEEAPQIWSQYDGDEKITINKYKIILKKKYQKYIENGRIL